MSKYFLSPYYVPALSPAEPDFTGLSLPRVASPRLYQHTNPRPPPPAPDICPSPAIPNTEAFVWDWMWV